MKVSPISITSNKISNVRNNNLSFSGTIKGKKIPESGLQQKQKDFLKNGGIVRFDTAQIDGKPFEGQLVRTYKHEQVGGFYANGEKYLIEFEHKNPLLNAPEGILLNNKFTMPNTASGKKIIWTSDDNNFFYIETYLSNGKLASTELTEFSQPDAKGNRHELVSQIAKFEEDGTTAAMVQTNITNPAYRNRIGYSKKVTNFRNGKPISEFDYNTKTANKSAEIKATIFGADMNIVTTEERNVKYYDGKNKETPVAFTDECITEYDKDGSVKTIIDTKYRTLEPERGLNPIREQVYKRLDYTRREIDMKSGCVSYINEATGKPYAIEKYQKGSSIPYEIINPDKNTTAKISQDDNGILSVQIFNNKQILLNRVLFQDIDNKWVRI